MQLLVSRHFNTGSVLLQVFWLRKTYLCCWHLYHRYWYLWYCHYFLG